MDTIIEDLITKFYGKQMQYSTQFRYWILTKSNAYNYLLKAILNIICNVYLFY